MVKKIYLVSIALFSWVFLYYLTGIFCWFVGSIVSGYAMPILVYLFGDIKSLKDYTSNDDGVLILRILIMTCSIFLDIMLTIYYLSKKILNPKSKLNNRKDD